MAFLTLALIAILSTACSNGRGTPTAPTTTTAVPPAPLAFEPNVAPPFPAISKPARLYVTTIEGYLSAHHGGALNARYVLYDDGSFALQYASARVGIFQYPGAYADENGKVSLFFQWRDSSSLGATAIMTEELLTVSYTPAMQENDFTDGVFMRVRD
ncbi:MAG TPA: hypothetical protein VJ691_16310 [Vicinamibacterales bacterium]|nr:hypothetical protein [Vicinamibacterales bacterium]